MKNKMKKEAFMDTDGNVVRLIQGAKVKTEAELKADALLAQQFEVEESDIFASAKR